MRKGARGHFCKSAIAAVVKKGVIAGFTAHEQVRVAVVVIVAPGATAERPKVRNDAAVANPGERAVAIISVQKIVSVACKAEGGHVQVEQAVAVVVAPSAT